jgi:undecaprenyl diphosphate synthase
MSQTTHPPFLEISKVPHHVGIIMDGNRRWARKNFIKAHLGHHEGVKRVNEIIARAAGIGIKVITLFAFSTENWKRNQTEVEFLLYLFEINLNKMKPSMQKEGVRLRTIGNLEPFPLSLKRLITDVEAETASNNRIELVLALNYGGRDELTRACKTIAEHCKNGALSSAEINEDLLNRYLDTANWQDPDLIIRTSGEMRLSNFLLWQASYAELYITETLWPDFSAIEFDKAILEYQKRQRRKGV